MAISMRIILLQPATNSFELSSSDQFHFELQRSYHPSSCWKSNLVKTACQQTVLHEVVNGAFARQVSGGRRVESMFPSAKHYMIVTGDMDLEVICTSPPSFGLLGPCPRLPPY